MPNTGIKLIVVGLLLFSPAKSVYAQNRDILQVDADVISLSQQVKLLQSSVNQNNTVLKELVGKIANQVNNVAASLQKLGQAINSLTTHGNNTAGEVHLQLTNLSNHVNELQNGLSAIQAQIGSVSEQITASKTTVEPLPGPEDLMRGAAVDALAGNYDLAVGGYMEFLSKYPGSPRAADAHFGLAEAYFNQKKYAQAIAEFDLFLQKYPQNDKTVIALYKKAVAQAGENELQQATDTCNQVIKSYPNTVEAANARLKIREIRASERYPPTQTRSTQKTRPTDTDAARPARLQQ